MRAPRHFSCSFIIPAPGKENPNPLCKSMERHYICPPPPPHHHQHQHPASIIQHPSSSTHQSSITNHYYYYSFINIVWFITRPAWMQHWPLVIYIYIFMDKQVDRPSVCMPMLLISIVYKCCNICIVLWIQSR